MSKNTVIYVVINSLLYTNVQLAMHHRHQASAGRRRPCRPRPRTSCFYAANHRIICSLEK